MDGGSVGGWNNYPLPSSSSAIRPSLLEEAIKHTQNLVVRMPTVKCAILEIRPLLHPPVQVLCRVLLHQTVSFKSTRILQATDAVLTVTKGHGSGRLCDGRGGSAE